MMRNRIAIIVTWFGTLPSYFSAWLKSAEENGDIDFYIFCDQEVNISERHNDHMIFIKTTLSDEVERISKRLGRTIKISTAYKFCDLRMYFGLGYAEYLKDYDFWGYCDIDLVFGRIRHFLTDEVLNSYDRFYTYGHLNVFRNNERMNHLYDLSGGIYTVDEILNSSAKCTPEEHFGLNRICEKNNISWYQNIDYCDFDPRRSDLHPLYGIKKHVEQIYIWKDGKALCVYVDNDGSLKSHEYVYMHWQKKKPVIEGELSEDTSKILIKPDYIEDISKVAITADFVRIKSLSLTQSETKKEKYCYYLNKIVGFMKSSHTAKKIWMRQMRYRVRKNVGIL